jgi:hypothetical protein
MYTWTLTDEERVISHTQLLSQAENLGLEATIKKDEDLYGDVVWKVLLKTDDDQVACAFHDAMGESGHKGLLQEGGFR